MQSPSGLNNPSYSTRSNEASLEKPFKGTLSKESELIASVLRDESGRLHLGNDVSPRSVENADVEQISGPRYSSLMETPSVSFHVDTDLDFFLPPDPVSFPTASGNQGFFHASVPSEHSASDNSLGSQQPVFNTGIFSISPLDLGDPEDGGRKVEDYHNVLGLALERRVSPANFQVPISAFSKRKGTLAQSIKEAHRQYQNIFQQTQRSTVDLQHALDWQNYLLRERTQPSTARSVDELEPRTRSTNDQRDRSRGIFSLLACETGADIWSYIEGMEAARNQSGKSRFSSVDNIDYIGQVLDTLPCLNSVSNSLLKLQTTLLFAVMASNIQDSRLSEILGIAIRCARDLRFNDLKVVERTLKYPEERKLAKRIVWLLYCLETNFAVQRGMAPLFHSDFINHLPTTPDHPENHDYLALQTVATALLARGSSRVYGHLASPRTAKELQACISILDQWHHCLPDHVKELIAGQRFESLNGDSNALMKLRLFCLYHECVYLLYAPWLPLLFGPLSIASSRDMGLLLEPSTPRTDNKPILADALSKCLEVAFMIVSHANEIIAMDKTLISRLRGLIIISTCVTTYGVLYGDLEMRKRSLAYLGVCCGTFSGMYLADASLPFEQVLDLVRIIRSED
ncbi:hypothetical protein BX600DRAFT_440025 [Xylariales sp. PMI_506]|nr:hypothetical protein BX600DRAFT_440025 [Xylariales sp. PMI_506]